MKKLALNVPMTDTHGKVIRNSDNTADADLRYICTSALVAPFQGTGDQKFARACLAARLHQAGSDTIVTDDELAELRKVVGEAFASPEVVRAAWLALSAAEEHEPEPCRPPADLPPTRVLVPKKKR